MSKWYFAVFAVFLALLVLPGAFGETLYERSFAEMGYEGFAVEGAKKQGCFEMMFLYPEDVDFWEKEIYPIASIGMEFGPVLDGIVDVNVLLNGQEIAVLRIEDFKCSGKCWERLSLPKALLHEEENELIVCIGTGYTITKAVLLGDSMLGLYKAADFSNEKSFVMQSEKTELVFGEKTRITMILHNGGSAPAFAEVQFARPVAEDKNAFSVVEGKNYFRGTVEAGETKEIIYVVKPRFDVPMTLPPAIVYYENEFGETEQKFSNQVFLNVRQPERKIEAFVVKEEQDAFVGQGIGMRLAVKNVGNDPLYSLAIELESEASIAEKSHFVESLLPKETKYLAFTASSLEAGKKMIGCTVTYTDANAKESQCLDSFVEFREQEIPPLLYAAIVLVLVAAIAYIYIMKS